MIRSSRRALNVLTVLDGELGVRNRVGALPALLDRRGVAEARVPSLSARERVLLDTALAT
jgi:malate/lactate dehydrogenase